MMHAFRRTFTGALREIVPPIDLPPLTPAAYLRLRREAAGLSVREAAAMMARTSADVWPALDLISVLETLGAKARYRESLDRLRTVFAFDLDVYYQLAEEPAERHPRVCRSCGCSKWDASDEAGQGCAWATDAACTRCIDYALEQSR